MHGDVKPTNVLLSPAVGRPFHVTLVDFGISVHAGAERAVGATVDYAAPEQLEGGPLDARTDTYGLGCLAFECLTGRPPFSPPAPAVASAAPSNRRRLREAARGEGMPAPYGQVVGSVRTVDDWIAEAAITFAGDSPESIDRAVGRLVRSRTSRVGAVDTSKPPLLHPRPRGWVH